MANDRAVMLSTIDNPYNPFTQWDEWLAFDNWHGYHTNEYLARVAIVSNSFTDEKNIRLSREAIDNIVKTDPLGIYIKVYEDTTPVPVSLDTVGGS